MNDLGEEIAGQGPDFASISQSARDLRTRLEVLDSGMDHYSAAKVIAGEAERLLVSYLDFIRAVPREERDDHYPERGKVYREIARAWWQALDACPFSELSWEEQDKYVEALFKAHGLIYHKKASAYHQFGLGRIYFEIPEGRRLLKTIGEDHDFRLKPEQEEKVYAAEQNEFKVHINCPSEQRIPLLKHLVAILKADSKLVDQIFEDKKRQGKSPSASLEEMRARGARLSMLRNWKMKTHDNIHSENPTFADFVVYIISSSGQASVEALELTVRELEKALESFELPFSSRLPRYSTPVILDGEPVPGLSVCQGNGDFKAYLERMGGKEKLKKYYDSSTNYALRKGVGLNF